MSLKENHMYKEYFSNKLLICNFILSLMIVSYHAVNLKVYNLVNNFKAASFWLFYLEMYVSSIQSVAVPMFFVISGFLFFNNFKIENLFYKYKKRFFSLFIPYIIWNSLSYCFYLFITNIPFFEKKMSMSPIRFDIISIYEGVIMGKYNALWFIRVLMLLVLIAPIIYYLSNNKGRGLIFLGILLIAHFEFYTNEFSILYCSIYYILGSYLALNYKSLIINKVSLKYSILSIILFALTSVIFINNDYLVYTPVRQIILIINCACFWMALDIIKFPIKVKWFYKISFFIYCIHGPILESIEKLWLIIFGNNLLGALTDYILAPVLTLILIFSIAYLLQKKTPRIWIILTGWR